MSFFNWLSPGRRHKSEPHPSVMPSSGMSRMESTKPANAAHPNGAAHAANRKRERLARREQLYGVVRESMVRASVLSSTYKFKVLSLDSRGRQFMVMVDLAQGAASDTTRLAEIEAMVAQTAKARYDILVSAVYWRANEYVAIGDPVSSHRMPLISQPAPLLPELPAQPRGQRASVSRPAPLGEISRPAPLGETSRPAPLSPTVPGTAPQVNGPVSRPGELRATRPDPLGADEVDAFRKALDAGLRGEQALAKAHEGKPPGTHPAAHNYGLLTGFEDTEMPGEEGVEHLSATQYGLLR